MIWFLLKHYRIVLMGFLLVFLFGFFMYFNHLRISNAKMKEEIKRLKVELNECQKVNSQLVSEIKLNEERYQEKIKKILKIANKPIKVIEIPRIIEKPVPISDEDCQKMGKMIDEFIEVKKNEGKAEDN